MAGRGERAPAWGDRGALPPGASSWVFFSRWYFGRDSTIHAGICSRGGFLRAAALRSLWNDAQGMAGLAGVPVTAFEWTQVDAVGDGHAVAVLGAAARAVENQRHAVGAAADFADPQDNVRDFAAVVFHEQEVAGEQGGFKVLVFGGKLDAFHRCGAACAGTGGGGQHGLILDVAGRLDAEGEVVNEGGEVAAIEALGHWRGLFLILGPVCRRLPVRDVVVLVGVADKAQARGNDALARPLRAFGCDACGRIKMLGRRSPVTPALLIGGVVPVVVRHARLILPTAAWSLKEITDQIFLLEGEFDFVRRRVISGAERAAAQCDNTDNEAVEVAGLHGDAETP